MYSMRRLLQMKVDCKRYLLWSVLLFVELTTSIESIPAKVFQPHSFEVAALHMKNGITIDLYNETSSECLKNFIGVASHFRIPQNIFCHSLHGVTQRHGGMTNIISFPPFIIIEKLSIYRVFFMHLTTRCKNTKYRISRVNITIQTIVKLQLKLISTKSPALSVSR